MADHRVRFPKHIFECCADGRRPIDGVALDAVDRAWASRFKHDQQLGQDLIVRGQVAEDAVDNFLLHSKSSVVVRKATVAGPVCSRKPRVGGVFTRLASLLIGPARQQTGRPSAVGVGGLRHTRRGAGIMRRPRAAGASGSPQLDRASDVYVGADLIRGALLRSVPSHDRFIGQATAAFTLRQSGSVQA